MPIYDYKCKQCGHTFEAQQSMAEAPLKTCPKCGGLVHRVISASGVIFKGSGFHITDYAKGKSLPPVKKKDTGTPPKSK